MNIELNNEGTVHSFDVDGNRTEEYLHEIAMKVFNLQRNTFVLQYKDRPLPMKNLRLQELFGVLHGSIKINLKVINLSKPQLSSLPQSVQSTPNIKCICNKNASISFCPSCDTFLCTKCVFQHSPLHELIQLEKPSQSIMIYQKNLFSKLNNMTRIYNNCQHAITENNDNIAILLDQSTSNIIKIKEKHQALVPNFKHEKIMQQDSLLESIKKKMLDLNNLNPNLHSTTSNSNITDQNQNLYATMKGFSEMNTQLKEFDNKVDPLRQLVNYQTHVIEYLMMISKSINDLLNQLMMLGKTNTLTTESYDQFMEKISVFLNNNTELIDTSKIKHNTNIASMTTDYTLSPPITNGSGSNNHDHLNARSSGNHSPLNNQKTKYKPIYTIPNECLSQAYNHIKTNLIEHMNQTTNNSRNKNTTEANISKVNLSKASLNKNDFKKHIDIALSSSNPCLINTSPNKTTKKEINNYCRNIIQDTLKKKDLANTFRSSLKNYNQKVQYELDMKKTDINNYNQASVRKFASPCAIFSQQQEPESIDPNKKKYNKQKSISMNIPHEFVQHEALDVLHNLQKSQKNRMNNKKCIIDFRDIQDCDSDHSPESPSRKEIITKKSTKGFKKTKQQSFFIPDLPSMTPQIAMITRKAKAKKKKSFTNIFDFLV